MIPVLDASIVVEALIGTPERRKRARALCARTWQATDLCAMETVAVLVARVAGRVVRFSVAELQRELEVLFSSATTLRPSARLWRQVLATAMAKNHKAYDVFYVVYAEQSGRAKLVTIDPEVLRKWPHVAVHLDDVGELGEIS